LSFFLTFKPFKRSFAEFSVLPKAVSKTLGKLMVSGFINEILNELGKLLV
jgi:hypothetical protein